jgi:SAM-dependent methyltransferase
MIEGDKEYESTRRAWREIWDAADVRTQLETRHYARSRHVRDSFAPHLPIGELILEAGCGLGVEMVALAERGHRIVGVDYAVGALRRLKNAVPSSVVAAGDIHALPFPDGVFGGYLSFGVLEHFRSGPEAGLREANRVLRHEGTLVITVPAPSLVWRLARARNVLSGVTTPAAGSYYETAYTARRLEAYVRAAGFDIVHREHVSHAFTLWGLGGPFRATGYYRTSPLADRVGALLSRVLPRAMSFATLIVARKIRAL